jgi:hypothetical protein
MVSMEGRSTPSLNRSTEKMTCRRAVGEPLQRVAAAQGRATVYGRGRDTVALELVGHVLGVADRHAEGEGALLGAAAPLLQRVPRAGEGGQFVRELFRVEAAVAPGDLAVVDRLVPDAVVVERSEQSGLDPGEQVAGEHEVVVAQGQDVGLVGAVRGGGEPEQEARLEVAEQAPVGGRGGVVEFVDHDVIEVVRREALEVGALAQCLHRRAEHVDLGVADCAHVEADAGLGADAREGVRGLAQDLLAVGDEQHASGAHVFGVEGREPGLAETGGEHDEAAPVAFESGGVECGEGLGLDRRRFRRRFGFLASGGDRARRRGAALFVGVDPVVGERDGARVAEDLLEPGARFEEAVVAGVLDAVVPLQPVGERLAADVAGADEGGAAQLVVRAEAGEQVGLQVEAGAGGTEHARLGALFLQQHQQAQRLGVGHVEVVAGDDTDAGRGAGGFLGSAEGGVEVGEEHPQAGDLHEADGEVDIVGVGDRVAELREEGVGMLAGDESGGLGGLPAHERVQPGLGAVRAPIRGEPAVDCGKLGQCGQPVAQARFGGVGGVSAFGVDTLAVAVLQAQVQDAVRFESGPEPVQRVGEFDRGQVQQAGAGPDAVVGGALVEFLEALHLHRLADALGREASDFRGGVEGAHPVAALQEGEAVAPRAAAGVEDEPAGGDLHQEALAQHRQLDLHGFRDIPRGIPVVVGNRVGHSLWFPLPMGPEYRGGGGSGGEPAPTRTERAIPGRWLAERLPHFEDE